MSGPVLTIVAGPNGSDKSSLTALARRKFQQVAVLDPDAIAQSLRESSGRAVSDMEAGEKVIRDAELLLQAGQSFAVETTLSGSTYLKMAARAKKSSSREEERARCSRGGPAKKISAFFGEYGRLLRLVDYLFLFDNSSEKGHTLLASGRVGSLE